MFEDLVLQYILEKTENSNISNSFVMFELSVFSERYRQIEPINIFSIIKLFFFKFFFWIKSLVISILWIRHQTRTNWHFERRRTFKGDENEKWSTCGVLDIKLEIKWLKSFFNPYANNRARPVEIVDRSYLIERFHWIEPSKCPLP